MNRSSILLPISPVPPIAFIAVALHHTVSFDCAEHYVKQSVRNRYHIAGPNGVQVLSIPVRSAGAERRSTAQMYVDHSKAWARQHWRSIQAAYGSAPFFEHYADAVQSLLFAQYTTLLAFHQAGWHLWTELLQRPLELQYQESYVDEWPLDWRRRWKQPADFNGEYLLPAYAQVFEERYGFQPHLSILDLLMNVGSKAAALLGTRG